MGERNIGGNSKHHSVIDSEQFTNFSEHLFTSLECPKTYCMKTGVGGVYSRGLLQTRTKSSFVVFYYQ